MVTATVTSTGPAAIWRRSRVGWSSCSKREFQKAAPKQMRRIVPEDTSTASGCSTEQSPEFAH